MKTKLLLQALILAGILFVHFTCSFAQERSPTTAKQAITPEMRALIAELMEATQARQTSLAIYNSMLDQQESLIPDVIWQGLLNTKEIQELSSEAKEELRKQMLQSSNAMSKRLRELFARRIDFTQIVEDISYELYSKYFTEAEIKDLVAFYKSPTGKKSIGVSPKMFAESMNITAERIKPKVLAIVTELTDEESERIRKELEARNSKQPVKPKPARRSRKRT
jgi:hypothetical protein